MALPRAMGNANEMENIYNRAVWNALSITAVKCQRISILGRGKGEGDRKP